MLVGKDTLTGTICKDMEKENGVVDTSKVSGYTYPAIEGLQLLPSSGILLADRGRKTLGDSLSCSI